MKKALAALLLSTVLVSGAAYAVIPWLALGASVALHAAFGLVYAYFVSDTGVTNPGGKAIRVTFKVNDAADTQQIIDEQKQTPSIPGTTQSSKSGHSVTVISKDGAYSYTASGDSFQQFIESGLLCPSHICDNTSVSSTGDPYGTTNAFLRFAFRRASGATFIPPDATSSGKSVYNWVASPAEWYTMTLNFQAPRSINVYSAQNIAVASYSCSSGYTINLVNGNCDLSNPDAVVGASLGDGVCSVFSGKPDLFDVDCQSLKTANKLTESTSDGGAPATSVAMPDGTVVTAVDTGAATTISQLKPASGGGYVREDTVVSDSGQVGVTNTTNYPSSPPPTYPGAGTGTSIPGGSTGGTSVVAGCGGPDQPPCQVTFGEGDGTTPADGFGDALPDTISGPLGGLADGAVLPVSAYCPSDAFSFTMPLPYSAGGPLRLDDGGAFCSAMDIYGPLMRTLAIAAAWIAATFIVLRA